VILSSLKRLPEKTFLVASGDGDLGSALTGLFPLALKLDIISNVFDIASISTDIASQDILQKKKKSFQ
jgi:hypothetical protein